METADRYRSVSFVCLSMGQQLTWLTLNHFESVMLNYRLLENISFIEVYEIERSLTCNKL